ncbi:MAG: ABC transporter permease [Thermomicrobiales bacterium]
MSASSKSERLATGGTLASEDQISGSRLSTKARSPLSDTINTLKRKPVALAGLFVILAWLALGILAPVLPIDDPNLQNLKARLEAPSSEHFFGTDELGRDLFSRIIFGARVSVPSGLLVVAISGVVGCAVGALSGFFGGLFDALVMRLADAVLAFPSIILAMTITAVRGGPGLSNALLAVAFVLWPEYARLMRAQVLQIKENDYVTAASALGAPRWRIILRHILPATDAPIIVKATFDIGAAIVLTAGLSFIGLGAVPPTAEWGAIIKQGADKGLEYWWYAAAPGLSIVSIVMALSFFGDGLRDALDPKRRER